MLKLGGAMMGSIIDKTVISEIGEWTGNTSGFTFSGANITAKASVTAAIKSVDTFTGDFTFRVTCTGNTATDDHNWVFGVYEIDEDGSFTNTDQSGDMNLMTDSYWVRGYSSDIITSHGGSTDGSPSGGISVDDVFQLIRTSGTFSLKRNDSVILTWGNTSSNEVRLAIAGSGGVVEAYEDVSWTPQ
jgi:hypothetical protein